MHKPYIYMNIFYGQKIDYFVINFRLIFVPSYMNFFIFDYTKY